MITIDTTYFLVAKMGEGTTTTAPDYAVFWGKRWAKAQAGMVTETYDANVSTGSMNGSTNVTLVSKVAPATSDVRIGVKGLVFCNRDTVAHTYFVSLATAATGGTEIRLVNNVSVAANCMLVYDENGWRVEPDAQAPNVSTAVGILPPANGGTGISNAGTITNANNTTITGGGTLALAGFTLTVPATGTAALLGTQNVFTVKQTIDHATNPEFVIKVGGSAVGEIQNFAASGSLPNPGISIGDVASCDVAINRFVANNFAVCAGSNNPLLFVKGSTGVVSLSKGADVASAAAIVPTGNIFHVTGTADITSITSTNILAGTRITMIFDGNAATTGVTDGSNLKLAGNFAYTTDDTMTLVYDGTNWYEVARSVN